MFFQAMDPLDYRSQPFCQDGSHFMMSTNHIRILEFTKSLPKMLTNHCLIRSELLQISAALNKQLAFLQALTLLSFWVLKIEFLLIACCFDTCCTLWTFCKEMLSGFDMVWAGVWGNHQSNCETRCILDWYADETKELPQVWAGNGKRNCSCRFGRNWHWWILEWIRWWSKF